MRLLSWLRAWGRSSTPALTHLRVVLYTRDGCHLCDDGLALLSDAQKKYRFELDVLDIDRSPELKACYGEWVPVVTMDSNVRFKGGVNPVLLRRLLRAELSRRTRRRDSV
jgi:hypothetical protein